MYTRGFLMEKCRKNPAYIITPPAKFRTTLCHQLLFYSVTSNEPINFNFYNPIMEHRGMIPQHEDS